MPTAKSHKRYLGIRNKTSSDSDERYQRIPTHKLSLKRGSTSRSPSPSPTRTDFTEDEIPPVLIPTVVNLRDARSLIHGFRANVWARSGLGCAITREGSLNGKATDSVEAAHIVPQSQWYTFPMDDEGRLADNDAELERAWRRVWS